MNELWARPQGALARELVEVLASNPAVTTVLTILDRLVRKQLVRRERQGRAHRYFSVHSREAHVADTMRDALHEAVDRELAFTHFLDSADPEDIAALRRLLDTTGSQE